MTRILNSVYITNSGAMYCKGQFQKRAVDMLHEMLIVCSSTSIASWISYVLFLLEYFRIIG